MTGPRQPLNTAQRIRYTVYAAAVTIAFMAILDGVLTWMEARNMVTLTTLNDSAWILYSDPWEDNGQGWYTSDPKDNKFVSAGRFRVEKQDTWRGFILGASFIMGAPYTHVGGIPFWLRRALRAHHPGKNIELVNSAQSAQNAGRVREITEYALKHEPDALIVATCNNEGALPPNLVTERLHRMETFRLFRRLLKSEDSAQRSLYTPQDPDVDKLRSAFRSNLRAIIDGAAAAGVPVLLCTLPVNLRYTGNEPGLPIAGYAWDPATSEARNECVGQGNAVLATGNFSAAEQHFRRCEHVEALRGLGLAQYGQKKYDAARITLTQYVELQPRNRCRPSFNAVVREEALRAAHVTLVDLEKWAQKLSEGGIPGEELFVDYCHMNWETQGKVADVIRETLMRVGAGPKWPQVVPELTSRKRTYERLKDEPPPPIEEL